MGWETYLLGAVALFLLVAVLGQWWYYSREFSLDAMVRSGMARHYRDRFEAFESLLNTAKRGCYAVVVLNPSVRNMKVILDEWDQLPRDEQDRVWWRYLELISEVSQSHEDTYVEESGRGTAD